MIINDKEWTWSYSKLAKIMECPYAFFREFLLLDVVAGKNNAFAIGSGLHDAIEHMTIDKADGELKPASYYEDIFRNSVLNNDDLMPVTTLKRNGSSVKLTGAQYTELFVGTVTKYHELGKILKPKRREKPYKGQKYYTESWGRLNVDDFEVVLKIDIIMDGAIIDYKTANKRYAPSEIDNPLTPKGLQASIYGAWYFQEFGEIPFSGFQIIGKEDLSKPEEQFFVQQLGFQLTEGIIRDTIETIRFWHAWFKYYLETKSFPNNPERSKSGCLSGRCYFCNYKRWCL